MIARLTGSCIGIDADGIVIDVSGVGYFVRASSTVLAAANREPQQVSVHTYLQVREDALQLYGFATIAELRCFERLIALQGIGPKVALAIVSAVTPAELQRAAQSADTAVLERVSGVGPKVARRIVTELRDKVIIEAFAGDNEPTVAVPSHTPFADARDALVGLGIAPTDAEVALRDCDETLAAEDMVRAALKQLRAVRA